jgi:chain length determinant protein EpsF
MSFSQFISIIAARWKLALAVFLAVLLSAIAIALLLPRGYVATASVVVEGKPDPLSTALYPGGINPGLIATQIDVINSERVAYRVVRNLKLIENQGIRAQWMDSTKGEVAIEQWLGDLFQKSLEVRPSRESSVINVSYVSPDPRFAAALANAFVSAYLETNLEMRVEPAKLYSSFFSTRASEARDTLEKAQAKLSAYQRENEIVANDERLDVENARLTELSSQLTAVQAVAAESSFRNAQATGSTSDRVQDVLSNPLIAGLKGDLSRSEVRLEELSARYGDRHPLVIETKANIEELRNRVNAETKRVTGGVTVTNTINRQREGEIKAALEAQRAKLLKMKAARDEITTLSREVETAQRVYEQIQQRQVQTALEGQATQSNVSVLTQAVPPSRPTYPRRLIISLVGAFLGVLLAIAVTMARESFDRRLRSVDDVIQALGLPVLGQIPGPQAKRLFGLGRKKSGAQPRLMASSNLGGKVA